MTCKKRCLLLTRCNGIITMARAKEAYRSCLLADLNALASDAKRPDSLAGQLTGWISGPEHPSVKDAAEKVIRELGGDSWVDVLNDSEVLLTACPIGLSIGYS